MAHLSARTDPDLRNTSKNLQASGIEPATSIALPVPAWSRGFISMSRMMSLAICSRRSRLDRTRCKVPHRCFSVALATGVSPLVFASNQASIFSGALMRWSMSRAS